MTTNGHHPGVGLTVDPAHMIPAPPPPPTAADGHRGYQATAQPAQQAQPMPTSPPTEPTPTPAPATAQVPEGFELRPVKVSWFKQKPARQYGAVVAGFAVVALALPAWNRLRPDPGPDPQIVTLTSTVEALQAQLATATKPEPLEVNPLNVLPCSVTNDARRFIGLNRDGSLNLAQSTSIARSVQDHLRRGATDYGVFVVRTGTSVSQLEVDVQGRGVQLFDCGRPVTTPTTAPETTPTTGAR